MRRVFVLFWILSIPIPPSFADSPTYKCSDKGKTIFSQTPCNGQSVQTVDIKTSHPTSEQHTQALREHQRRLTELNKLQKAKEKMEAKDAAQARTAANKAASEKKQCDAQKLKVKWANEDLNTSTPSSAQRLQTKARRAQEKMTLTCKSS